MSKKNRTATLAVLCGALIVCVGGYFVARGISAAEEKKNAEEETQSIPVTEYSADGMQTLSIIPRITAIRFPLQKPTTAGRWTRNRITR